MAKLISEFCQEFNGVIVANFVAFPLILLKTASDLIIINCSIQTYSPFSFVRQQPAFKGVIAEKCQPFLTCKYMS
jgi:hypothetical protein